MGRDGVIFDFNEGGLKEKTQDANFLGRFGLPTLIISVYNILGTSIGSLVFVALLFSALIIFSWHQNFILNRPKDNIPVTGIIQNKHARKKEIQ